jgi:hypothetical protein
MTQLGAPPHVFSYPVQQVNEVEANEEFLELARVTSFSLFILTTNKFWGTIGFQNI